VVIVAGVSARTSNSQERGGHLLQYFDMFQCKGKAGCGTIFGEGKREKRRLADFDECETFLEGQA